MTLRAKNLIYTLILLVSMAIVGLYNSARRPPLLLVEGATMGTTYHIKYADRQGRDFKSSLDSLLNAFNLSLNTYWPQSEISTFNKADGFRFQSPFFFPVLERSQSIVKASQGAFDPTVMPLVNAWGFGPGEPMHPDSAQIDSIRSFVGFEKVHFSTDSVWKSDPRVQLDFSAIAKGYGVDLVADFIHSCGVQNYMVEIGGEVAARGVNPSTGRPWKLGILDPSSSPENMQFSQYISLDDKAMATSGNYFNYRVEEGRKFSHTIDPETGYPVQRTILSASVVADDCMTADAWATAFMVMGFERAKEKLESNKTIEALFIYSTPRGDSLFVSEPLREYVESAR